MSKTPIIETKHLTKKFGSVTTLNEFDMTVQEGEVHGFLGPNGAGKSTTVLAIATTLAQQGGSVTIIDAANTSSRRVCQRGNLCLALAH